MSATTELLLEQIKKVEESLAVANSLGDEIGSAILQKKLLHLRSQFNASASALNEGKAVLKG